ncbi:hypothetical protein BKA67DRAFT_580038 [Truncatella angustata]|uniref:DUF6594 domain-containing protein n=1 Tax=Truncatella angustata TaxID=152316 RepID=A0A9P8UCS2_9PEZI|nr:uncharacterized protein BKA67DRAFT_580038 [Truncatella angustata]KAH6646595.1 hypothetical protein BKA67DRAFT_580038 [Truncatella angustata]
MSQIIEAVKDGFHSILGLLNLLLARMQAFVASCVKHLRPSIHNSCGHDCQHKQIEDYRPGYPRYSALIGAHKSLYISRRFSNVRSRLLLLKQDRIARLESRLEKIDEGETAPLFLGSHREDQNSDRKDVLAELDSALTDYDNFLIRNQQMLNFPPASRRDVESLANWVNNNGCLSWEETEYLTRCNDLLSVAPTDTQTSGPIETWMEGVLVRFFERLRDPQRDVSRDKNVHIFSARSMARFNKLVAIIIIILAVSVPLLICSYITTPTSRIIITICSLATFIVILSSLTSAKLVDLFVAGATYTTVLTIFIPQ